MIARQNTFYIEIYILTCFPLHEYEYYHCHFLYKHVLITFCVIGNHNICLLCILWDYYKNKWKHVLSNHQKNKTRYTPEDTVTDCYFVEIIRWKFIFKNKLLWFQKINRRISFGVRLGLKFQIRGLCLQSSYTNRFGFFHY